MLRREMANVDSQGRPLVQRAENTGGRKYFQAFYMLVQWIDENLEVYKAELDRVKWPVFVYSFLNLVSDNYPELAAQFFESFKHMFTREHAVDLQALELVRHQEHIDENETARLYSRNAYRLTLVESTHFSLLSLLENKERVGGSVILAILQNSMQILTVDRAATADRSFASLLARQSATELMPEEDEGIPGHNPGSANTDRNAPPVLTRLSLGPLPMDTEAATDVREELEEADTIAPPGPGQSMLVEELDQRIKREASEDVPSRDLIPLPKPLARDVIADVQRIKQHRDRFKLPARGSTSQGQGPGVSVTMFTFHNTYDSINCLKISSENELIAAGTAESYIRVWTVAGSPLPSLRATEQPTASRRLIGHAGPVFDVSFSPNSLSPLPKLANDTDNHGAQPLGNHHLLLSCSADCKVRLWCLATCTCLCVYSAHTHPVWAVEWSPHGHYFASTSADRTARVWSTEHISPLRVFAGHDSDVETLCWHPNGCYIFTGGNDRTVRMWDVNKGTGVRLFTGHVGIPTCLAASPTGKVVASADDRGSVVLWDLESGRRVKVLRGHGRGGIWSLSWSIEGTVLASGGADATVRIWDALSIPTAGQESSAVANGPQIGVGKGDNKDTKKSATVGPVGVAGSGVVSKKDDSKVSPEQISVFPTKKSPVYTVRFTTMNLLLAAGSYLPNNS